MPLPLKKTVFSIAVLLALIFSKFVYMESLKSYYTFYLIHKFGVTIQTSQLFWSLHRNYCLKKWD